MSTKYMHDLEVVWHKYSFDIPLVYHTCCYFRKTAMYNTVIFAPLLPTHCEISIHVYNSMSSEACSLLLFLNVLLPTVCKPLPFYLSPVLVSVFEIHSSQNYFLHWYFRTCDSYL